MSKSLELSVRAYEDKPEYAGQLITCPNCNRKLCEAEFLSFLKRCPKCGRWVLAEKIKKTIDNDHNIL